ncbi:hypothetical protein Syun_009833 [Stephania yunnanensis]|uniref:Uncharacterized protein n=1 Tax=Stephania yunnanensis TaxID=152371 RepID=A0AAP0PR19_9MAGN
MKISLKFVASFLGQLGSSWLHFKQASLVEKSVQSRFFNQIRYQFLAIKRMFLSKKVFRF